METTLLMSKAISSGEKFFHLSRVLFELSDFEERATEKNQDFNAEIFKLNDRLRDLLFFLILGNEFSKVYISKTACPNLKIFYVS